MRRAVKRRAFRLPVARRRRDHHQKRVAATPATVMAAAGTDVGAGHTVAPKAESRRAQVAVAIERAPVKRTTGGQHCNRDIPRHSRARFAAL